MLACSSPLETMMTYLFCSLIESLFGCFDDCQSCMLGCCCPGILFGQNAEKISGSNCFLMCCAYSILQECALCWIPHCMKRGDLRERFGLPEDQCDDFLSTFFCSPCALCQEARFLERRGMFHSKPLLILHFLLTFFQLCHQMSSSSHLHQCWFNLIHLINSFFSLTYFQTYLYLNISSKIKFPLFSFS